jgi:hypothetical protein
MMRVRRHLIDNKFEAMPRGIESSHAIAEHVRAIRLIAGGR